MCLIGQMSFGSTDALAQKASRRGEEPARLMMAKSAVGSGDLEVLETSAASASPRRQPVTDLGIRLKARSDIPISVALAFENGDARVRGRSIFQLELLVVAGGRLLFEERAECRAWQGDVSICDTECDGGQFALMRARGGGQTRLKLIIGAMPDTVRDSLSPGVRIGACSERNGVDQSLAPCRGLRQVEIDFGPP